MHVILRNCLLLSKYCTFSTYLLVLLTLLLEVENTHKEKLILVDLKLVLFPFVEESHFNHVSQVPYIVWCFILVWPFVLELLSPTGWQNTVFPEVNTPQREVENSLCQSSDPTFTMYFTFLRHWLFVRTGKGSFFVEPFLSSFLYH